MKKISVMEIVWLVVTGLCLGFFVDAMIRYGWAKAYVFLILGGLSLLMYFWRRSLRQKEEND